MAESKGNPRATSTPNKKVIEEAPAFAMGQIYQASAHSLGIMFENAVNTQAQMNIIMQAATTQGVNQIYSIDTIADAVAVATMLDAENDSTAATRTKRATKKSSK